MVNLTFWRGPGAELGQGLAALATNLIGTQNTLKQQDEQKAQRDADNAFRQQQAEEQRRQFDASSKQARDTQAYQYIAGQAKQLTEVLAKGGYSKDDPAYKAAKEALSASNSLSGKVLRGVELTPEELQEYDTVLQNVGALTAGGAVTIGGRVAEGDTLTIEGQRLNNTGKGIANETGQAQLDNFRVVAPYQQNVARVQSEYAEPTAQAGLDSVTAQTEATRTGTQLTALQVEQVTKTLDGTIKAINSTNDLGVQKNAVLKGLLGLEGAASQAEFLGKIAAQGEAGQAILSGLVKDGLIDQATADGAMEKAKRVVKVETAQTDLAVIGVDTARFQLGDMKAKAPLVYEGLRLNNEGAQQLLDFNTAANPERLTQLQQDNERTRQAIDQSADLFPEQKALLTAQVDLTQTQAEVAEAVKDGTIDGTNAQNWQTIALAGNPAVFDRLVKEGKMTEQQAAPWKRLAEAAARKRNAEVSTAEATATLTGSNARVAVNTEGAQERIVTNQADTGEFNLASAKQLFPIQLKSAQTALDTANEQLAAFKEQRPYNLDLLKTNIATLKQELDQNAQLFGPRLAQARATVGQLESQLRVMEGSEGAAISTAQSGATTAAAQADSATAAAKVDTALIPARIQAGQIGVQAAQASLDAQLLENKFNDQTFSNRVRAVEVGTLAGVRQLMTMRQQYQQNAQKFPAELKYLNAQIAVMEEQAKTAAAANLTSTGGVTDKKTVLSSLDAMRKINADERRIAANNLRNVVQQFMPKAKFSVDRYNPQEFTTLVANDQNLSPDQRAALQAAQLAFDNASGKSSDLSTAFAQVSGKGRMDPKLAERLGFFAPGEGEDAGQFISGPSSPPAKAPKARNVPPGIVSGEGGVVYSGGGAKAVQSLLPPSEITKQITMTTDHYLGKIKQQGGYNNPWDNTAGPVRAYNGMGPSLDVQKRYVNDIRATYNAQPWVQAIADASGARKTELQLIDSEATRIAKQRGVDPNIIKAIMWNESMGWQPGIPSSDGKGGGLGQVTGYFPPKGSTYSSTTRGGPAPVTRPSAGKTTPAPPPPPVTTPPATTAPAAPPGRTSVSTPAANGLPPLAGVNLDKAAAGLLTSAFKTIQAMPAADQKTRGANVMSTLAAQLSSKYGIQVSPAQVYDYLKANGGRL